MADTFTLQQLLDDDAPGEMYDNPMVYDSVRNLAIMYGAYDGGTYTTDSNQTWEYNGTIWTKASPLANAGFRWYGASGAYDPDAQVFMMHGGRNAGGFLNQLWEYNGTTWVNRTPGAGPNPGNAGSNGLVYDTTNNVLIYYAPGTQVTYWFNRTTWQWVQMAASAGTPPPTNLSGGEPAFDQLRGVVVRFGGDQLGVNVADVYEFDFPTNTWSNPSPEITPGGRYKPSIAWSTALQKIVITGGEGDSGAPDYNSGYWGDVWTWDGTVWELISAPESNVYVGAYNASTYGIDDGEGHYQPDLVTYPWLQHCRRGRLMCDGGGPTGLLGSTDERGDVIVYGGAWIWPISVGPVE